MKLYNWEQQRLILYRHESNGIHRNNRDVLMTKCDVSWERLSKYCAFMTYQLNPEHDWFQIDGFIDNDTRYNLGQYLFADNFYKNN